MLDSQPTVRKPLIVIALVALLAGVGATAPATGTETRDALAWLQSYITIDSSTTAGARQAGLLLKRILHEEGIATKWIVAPDGQPFLYARTGPSSPATETLILMHHLDVVPAGSGWTRPAHTGEIFEGSIYGRGAVDDKSLGVAHLVSLLRFRQLTNPRLGLVLLAAGGEESGGTTGMGWLLDSHPELFANVTAVLTEGGTNRVYGKKVLWWGVEVAQKRPLWLQARASGRAGHGSSLNLHSAPHRLVRGLSRLVDRPLEFRVTPEARLFLEAVAPLESPAFAAVVGGIDTIVALPEPATRLLPGMPNYLLDTVQVNVLESGTDINVTPDTALAQIDVRLLPDTDEAAILDRLRELVGPDVELEVILSAPQVAPSPTAHAVFACLEEVLGAEAPVVPAFITAITDARFFREQGITVYGFSPFRLGPNALRGIHSRDEHIPVDAFARGIETMWSVVSRCAGR